MFLSQFKNALLLLLLLLFWEMRRRTWCYITHSFIEACFLLSLWLQTKFEIHCSFFCKINCLIFLPYKSSHVDSKGLFWEYQTLSSLGACYLKTLYLSWLHCCNGYHQWLVEKWKVFPMQIFLRWRDLLQNRNECTVSNFRNLGEKIGVFWKLAWFGTSDNFYIKFWCFASPQ